MLKNNSVFHFIFSKPFCLRASDTEVMDKNINPMSTINKEFVESYVKNKCLSIESNFYLPVIKDVQSLLKLRLSEKKKIPI